MMPLSIVKNKMKKRITRRKKQKGGKRIQIAYFDLPAYKTPTEDRITPPIVSENVTILGLFDGHGGTVISEHIYKELPARINQRISTSQDSGTIIKIINEEFEKMDKELEVGVGGSTATLAVITKTEIIIANVGDSPAILFKKDGTLVHHTDDHDCDNLAEYERITKAGGGCMELRGKKRLDTGLAVTRAFGDGIHDKRIVIATPQIYVWPRLSEAILCLCSDSFTEGYYNYEDGKLWLTSIGNIFKPEHVVSEIMDSIKVNNYDMDKSVRAAVERRVKWLQNQGDNTSLLLAYFP
jgi:serine/threonine protein phosphatase PrpC